MKISQLDIQGFRSLKSVSWHPGSLNVIIGPNGSGKSNLLRFLDFVSAAANGQLDHYIQAEGGIQPLIWDGQASSIEWKLRMIGFPSEHWGMSYETEILRFLGLHVVRREKINYQNTDSESMRQDNSKTLLSRLGIQGNVINDSGRQIDLRIEENKSQETFFSYMSQSNASNTKLHLFRRELAAWTIYQDFRLDHNAVLRMPSRTKHEIQISSDAQNLINVLHTLYTEDREFKRLVNSAMQAAFGNDFDELVFPPASDQRIQLRVRWKTLKREQSAADLSDGTLRFLFLIAVLASPNPAPLIAIDEPETGLHPSMLPLVAELAVDASERTQVVFTTHSDQLLDAFRGTRPTTTVARWENGETTLTTISDDDLAYWLKDYSLGQMFRSGELESVA